MQVLLYVLTALTVSLDCKLIQTSSTKDFKHDNDSSVIGASNRDKNRPSKSETNHLSAGSQYTDLAGRETSMETSTMNTTNCRRNNSKKLIHLKVEGHSIVASKSKKEENRCNIRRVDLRKLNTDGSAADGEREEIIRSLPDTPVVYTGHRNRNLLLSYLASSQNLTNSPAGVLSETALLVMTCHVMSCHVMSCHVMSCHVTTCHVTSSFTPPLLFLLVIFCPITCLLVLYYLLHPFTCLIPLCHLSRVTAPYSSPVLCSSTPKAILI